MDLFKVSKIIIFKNSRLFKKTYIAFKNYFQEYFSKKKINFK